MQNRWPSVDPHAEHLRSASRLAIAAAYLMGCVCILVAAILVSAAIRA